MTDREKLIDALKPYLSGSVEPEFFIDTIIGKAGSQRVFPGQKVYTRFYGGIREWFVTGCWYSARKNMNWFSVCWTGENEFKTMTVDESQIGETVFLTSKECERPPINGVERRNTICRYNAEKIRSTIP